MSVDAAAEVDKNPEEGPIAFDPRDEYRQLLRMVARDKRRERRPGARGRADTNDDTEGDDDVYRRLMSKERRVLDTIDRVVNDSNQRDLDDGMISRMAVHEIVMRVLAALRTLWDDLLSSRTGADVWLALSDKDRMPYVGMALVAGSALVAIVDFIG